MKIVFLSNYYNHHQAFLSLQLNSMCDDYMFIETGEMLEERKNMGYSLITRPKFVYKDNDFEKNELIKLIVDADVVIIGAAPDYLIKERIKMKKLIFRYSERIFKEKNIDIFRWIKYTVKTFPQRKHNVYYLFSSAYASSDYFKCGVKLAKCYKWGYFPECKNYDIDELILSKTQNSILWCARLIDLKHPEMAISVAKRLKKDGYDFTMNIIGDGELKSYINNEIIKENLKDNVHLLGSMTPENVRKYMEKSEIFLFTSDRHEGWGAVMNESMNSGCAVVASNVVGATPFLLKDNKNGCVFSCMNENELYNKVCMLLNDDDFRKKISKQAYYTISNEWNAKVAAERLIKLSNAILNGEQSPDLFEDGICSKA